MKKMSASTKRRLKYGSGAVIFTALFLVVIIGINLIASALVKNYPLNLDMTENQDLSLSKDAEKIITDVQQEIKIYVLGSETLFVIGSYHTQDSSLLYTSDLGLYYTSVNEILKSLPRLNAKISLEYIDVPSSPTFVSRYPDDQLANGQIIVECPSLNKHLIITPDEYLTSAVDNGNPQYNNYLEQGITLMRISFSNIESSLCSAVVRATNANPPIVTFLTGHGEASLDAFRNLLQKNSYDIKDCPIMTEEIDPESIFLIIAAPTVDYSSDDLRKIDAYLSNDKKSTNAFIFMSPNQGELKNLEDFMSEWAVLTKPGSVADYDRGHFYVNPNEIIATYGPTAYGASLIAPPVVYNSRPLYFSPDNGTTVIKKVVNSYETSVLVPQNPGTDWSPDKSEEKASFVLLTESLKIRAERVYSKLFVCGSQYFVRDTSLNNPSFGNARLILNIFNQNGGGSVSLYNRMITPHTFLIPASTNDLIGVWIFMITLPAIILITGTVIWIRRKNR